MKDRFVDALGKIDDDMIEDVNALRIKNRKASTILFRRWTSLAACLCLFVTGFMVYALASSDNPFFAKWGAYLGLKTETPGNSTATDEELYAVGKDGGIPLSFYEQTKEFYLLSGYTEEEAVFLTVSYVEEYMALYLEAVRQGFDVTEEEVRDKIESLKEMLSGEENAALLSQMMTGFSSEEAYWEYEYQVYQKSLPIEKYRMKLENDFFADGEHDRGNEADQDAWISWYDAYKEELVKKQAFQPVYQEKKQ